MRLHCRQVEDLLIQGPPTTLEVDKLEFPAEESKPAPKGDNLQFDF